MRPWLRPLFFALMAAIFVLPACSSDDDDDSRPSNPYDPSADEGLAGSWQAGDAAGSALLAADELWEAFADLAADPVIAADSTLQAARAFASACTTAAADLEAWVAVEELIVPDGGGNKAQLSEEARQTALAVLETAATAVRHGAEGLVVSWQTLGGLTSLREALADPEGEIPVNGSLATRLATRQSARDEAVVEAILAAQDRGGLLPLEQIEGATPAEQVAWYTDLEDEHAIKRQCRAAVAGWDAAERTASLDVLERAARSRLRFFSAAGFLDELPDHFTGEAETTPPTHDLTLHLVDGATGGALDTDAIVLIHRRGMPPANPRLALLADAPSSVALTLPAGQYDILALADGWARAVASDVATSDGGQIDLSLSHLEQASLILENVSAPAMAGAGTRVTATAVAASAAGRPLEFDWQVRGPCESVTPLGAECRFVPTDAGLYTAVVTVRDGAGSVATDSTRIEVLPFAVEVFQTDFLVEQIADYHLNPGEQDTLWLWVANRSEVEVRGEARLQGRNGLDVDVQSETWTLAAGRQTRWQVPVAIPADYDQPRAVLDFSFTADGQTYVQTLDYRVDFYVELERLNSPQTSRIITVRGTVANPALETAELVVDRDRNQIYTLPLDGGTFEQVVILAGTEQTQQRRLKVTARAGDREAVARAGFMAAIPRADFRATLFWDTNGTDVDLWVTDPDGEKCYYANQTTASGLELDVDDVSGYGPENITGESDLPAGEYLVQVHYFSDHGTGLASEATCMITLHEGTAEETVVTGTQTIVDGDVWTVATVVWDGAQVVSVEPVRSKPVAAALQALPAK
jgi:hypothetical protein